MKTSFKCLLRWGLLFIFGVIFSGKSFGQALVFGSTPSFSALNLKKQETARCSALGSTLSVYLDLF